MGNNITYEIENADDDDYLSSDGSVSSFNGDGETLSIALGSMLQQIVNQETDEMPPVIRKKPDLRVFRVSCVHKEATDISYDVS